MTDPNEIIERYKLDPELFPDEIKSHLMVFLNSNGAIFLDDVGLMLPSSDLDLIKACVHLFNPMVIAAPNERLFSMKDIEGDDCIPFTHLIPWYEDNVWILLFSQPSILIKE